MASVRLRFQDDRTVHLQVEPQESIAEAAIRHAVPLRHDCLSGECGACLAHCRDPAALTGTRASVLTPEEASEGLLATCQTRLLADTELQLDYPLEPVPSDSMRWRGEVTGHTRLCEAVSRVIVTLDDAGDFRFQPGQYLRLRPPGLRVARAFSIASTMEDLPHVELLIRHLDGGQVSGWLGSGATLGARVALQAPLGGFAADCRASRQIFIAGGTGLAPILSMIRSQTDKGGDLLLCFGCTRAEELFYQADLEQLARTVPGLEVRIALVEGAHGTIREGTALAQLAAGDLIEGSVCHLCGPPAMVDAARRFLRENGLPSGAIRAERFVVGV